MLAKVKSWKFAGFSYLEELAVANNGQVIGKQR
jgi:hypothetical protein